MKKILTFFIFSFNYLSSVINLSDPINLSPLEYNTLNAQIAINNSTGELLQFWEIFDEKTNFIQFSYSSESL